MRDHIALLPGWGFAPSVLQPLADALREQAPNFHVTIYPLPRGPADSWLAQLDASVPADAWLLGWSLGGQLAQALAAQRGEACPGVISVASNPSFVPRDNWPHALPMATLDAFSEGLASAPQATLKRFSVLCAQGATDARDVARTLQGQLDLAEHLQAGLALLADMDNRALLQHYLGPQLHLFAGHDALVPAEAAGDLLALLPDVEVLLVEDACHALPIECPALLAEAVMQFVHEAGDD
ncbi:alpha/beta fold hydrolase [Atopomonas sediminilitoris]|uniref:alpha/beta fold hydrolase n=1 Tax=Atopomonas sediminilitoris TaxID=2919919 RepID=UPI001F4E0CBD|nr:alpha/beta fold hydrolase [Atopomonas sediminilitoris]MCJ8170345.1 alpha/beta fold hydrolase [Atopomonas sediminilitoris]